MSPSNSIKEKYGPNALIAGGSEGIGGAFAHYLAAQGMNLVLIARRKEALEQFGQTLSQDYGVQITCINADLASPEAAQVIMEQIGDMDIHMLVYNAGNSYIDKFEQKNLDVHHEIVRTNLLSPLNLIHHLAPSMLMRGKGAIIMMASLAGFQGTPFIATYAATKAFDQILAESLWYEWKPKGLDVIACCAGATSSPNFIKTNPGKQNFFAPKALTPEAVVEECFRHLGKRPSFITGRANKIASFFMQRVLPRKKAVTIMGNTTKEMYRIED